VQDFNGAKLALFLGDDLLVYLRDDREGLAWSGYWDFPGGGREGDETPEETVLRETFEEFGLALPPASLVYARTYSGEDWLVWFFSAHVPKDRVGDIRFGEEGQCWELWSPSRYLEHAKAIPPLQNRLKEYLDGQGH